jgi:hypothetical protein
MRVNGEHTGAVSRERRLGMDAGLAIYLDREDPTVHGGAGMKHVDHVVDHAVVDRLAAAGGVVQFGGSTTAESADRFVLGMPSMRLSVFKGKL